MTARTVAHILFRHARIVAACLALALAAGTAAALLHEPRFRAEAVLAAGGGDTDALVALLQSRDLHESVLADLGGSLYPALPEDERTARFAADLTAQAAGASPVVRLAFEGSNPAMATGALAALVEAVTEMGGAGVADPAAERAALRERRAGLRAQSVAAEAEAQASEATLAVLKARLAETPRTIEIASESERSAVVEEARAKLFELETREQELLGQYQEDSVFVRRVRAEMDNARRLLDRLLATSDTKVTRGANQVHQHLEGEVVRTEARWTAARTRADALARQIGEIDLSLAALDGLPSGRASMDGVGVLQSAAARARAVGPGPAAIMGIAALAGLVLAIVAAGLAQRLSNRFATPADIERRLGLKVLTSIPRES